MNFFHITPKESLCGSRRWFVDDIGLNTVKSKYENYEKHGVVVNRWNEFTYKKVDLVWFDFGGMMHVETPVVSTKIHKTTFELLVTHVPTLIGALSSKSLMHDGYWQCATRFNSFAFSLETHEKLMECFTQKSKIYEEMIEGFNKHLDNVIASTNGRVRSIKKYYVDPKISSDPTIIMDTPPNG